MSNNNCKTIRSQVEEAALRDDYGQMVRIHLDQCEACRQFEKEQRSLRELVSGLGTIQAPADFDFKLRARLADQSSRRRTAWSLSPLFATAAAVILFIGVILGITYINKPQSPDSTATRIPSPIPVEPAPAAPNTDGRTTATSSNKAIEEAVHDEKKVRTPKRNTAPQEQLAYRPKRSIVALDSGPTAAQTYGTRQGNSPGVFPIDASLNPVRSPDDGRNARTISLPALAGSQRVLANDQLQSRVFGKQIQR
jgi:hypothetical protein